MVMSQLSSSDPVTELNPYSQHNTTYIHDEFEYFYHSSPISYDPKFFGLSSSSKSPSS